MKATKSITIDPEVWAKAKLRTDNISGTLEFLLRRWVETEAETYERNKIEQAAIEIDELKARLAVYEKERQDMRKEQERRRPVKVIDTGEKG